MALKDEYTIKVDLADQTTITVSAKDKAEVISIMRSMRSDASFVEIKREVTLFSYFPQDFEPGALDHD